ncbi:MAG: ATP-binding protein [Mongoliibacter sp.]|uniref:AlbA family DNA-binding domain-containing protein n=1 Tax=Mongoliibacter sp. TaxID=2022438 RepID=UPI0012F0ACCC|nr:ATP-binding protein [Mongoliibacter sp.]TVP49439.1 MAG: ATP-binding protein [Mongoliibacter sp.]
MLSPKKDEEYISILLQQQEGENLDFKQSINSSEKIAKTLSAFANTSGGQIVIGVSDQKQVLGIDEYEEMFMIEKAAQEYCVPPVKADYELYAHDLYDEGKEQFEEKNILIVKIQKSTVVHSVKKSSGQIIPYIRVRDKTLPHIQD